MNTMTTTEIIALIREIEATQGKHLPVRVESSSESGCQAVIDVKYRSSTSSRLPYIALITR